MLEVKNLTKVYVGGGLLRRRTVLAVDNISFTVKPREFVSLVGESGSGKTTTAKMILHLLKPTSGTILFMGRDVWKLRRISDLKWYWRNVHGVFQDPYAPFNPFYKVDRYLYQAFNLMEEEYSESERRRMVEEALIEVGLRPEYVLGKYPHELSGGMRQRIMIARCYMLRPKLILADEPVTMLDASTRAGILNLFSKLREEHDTAVIFITHDMGLAYYVSDRILIMRKGKIVEEGSPDEILEHPKHPYTKRLIEDVPLLYRKWSGF